MMKKRKGATSASTTKMAKADEGGGKGNRNGNGKGQGKGKGKGRGASKSADSSEVDVLSNAMVKLAEDLSTRQDAAEKKKKKMNKKGRRKTDVENQAGSGGVAEAELAAALQAQMELI